MSSFASLALVTLLALAVPSAPAHAQAARAAAPAPARASAAPHAAMAPKPAAGSKLDAPLPDSVLIRLFYGKGHEDISIRRLARTLQQLQVPADSVTPAVAQQVLQMLVQQRVLAHAAALEPRRWDHADSLDYASTRDHLLLKAALDSAMVALAFERMSHGDSVPDPQDMGVMLRDSAMARLHPAYDEDALASLATAFKSLPKPSAHMSVGEQMRLAQRLPTVSAADSARALVTSGEGRYTEGQLLDDFARLNPQYRPLIRSKDDLRDVAASQVYEGMLRRGVNDQTVQRRPAVAAALKERAEYLDVQHFIQRHAYAAVPTDSATLKREWAAHRDRYRSEERVRILRGTYAQREMADSARALLRDPAITDGTKAVVWPGTAPEEAWIAVSEDSALVAHARAVGEGGILGPNAGPGGWTVARVLTLEPGGPLAFADAAEAVQRDWVAVEGDRRARTLLAEQMQHVIPVPNEKILTMLFTPPQQPGAKRPASKRPAAHPAPHGATR